MWSIKPRVQRGNGNCSFPFPKLPRKKIKKLDPLCSWRYNYANCGLVSFCNRLCVHVSPLQKRGIRFLNQQGYLSKRGMDDANLRLINTFIISLDEQRPFYKCSWDTEKSFHSVYKLVILLLWQRFGVPLKTARRLIGFDPSCAWTAGTTRFGCHKRAFF